MIRPDPTAQHRPLVLTITPGMNGYRLAFAGGEHFEPIAEFADLREAFVARGEAVRLSSSAVKAAGETS